MTWSLFLENSWRVKSAGLGGVTGFDLDDAHRQLTDAGTDPDIAAKLLEGCAVAAIKAIHEKDDDDAEQQGA